MRQTLPHLGVITIVFLYSKAESVSISSRVSIYIEILRIMAPSFYFAVLSCVIDTVYIANHKIDKNCQP